jgi:hypothetical protein
LVKNRRKVRPGAFFVVVAAFGVVVVGLALATAVFSAVGEAPLSVTSDISLLSPADSVIRLYSQFSVPGS